MLCFTLTDNSGGRTYLDLVRTYLLRGHSQTTFWLIEVEKISKHGPDYSVRLYAFRRPWTSGKNGFLKDNLCRLEIFFEN